MNENGFKFRAYSRLTHFEKKKIYIIVAKWIIIGLVCIRHETFPLKIFPITMVFTTIKWKNKREWDTWRKKKLIQNNFSFFLLKIWNKKNEKQSVHHKMCTWKSKFARQPNLCCLKQGLFFMQRCSDYLRFLQL